jgi:hypothetical protein
MDMFTIATKKRRMPIKLRKRQKRERSLKI